MSTIGLSKVKYVSIGTMHTVALLDDNTVFSWGRNTFGQLGTGNKDKECFFSPQKLKNFSQDSVVKQIACGENHTMFLLSDG